MPISYKASCVTPTMTGFLATSNRFRVRMFSGVILSLGVGRGGGEGGACRAKELKGKRRTRTRSRTNPIIHTVHPYRHEIRKAYG